MADLLKMVQQLADAEETEAANTRGWLVSFWLSLGAGMMALGFMVWALVGALWRTLWST
jgi:4-amino-4-deoxy-L-arabinose transferase-like glycosyltransferase